MSPRPFTLGARSRSPVMVFPDKREAVQLATEGHNLALFWVRSMVSLNPFTVNNYSNRVLRRVSEQPGVFAATVFALIEAGNIDAAKALCKRMAGR